MNKNKKHVIVRIWQMNIYTTITPNSKFVVLEGVFLHLINHLVNTSREA